MITKNAELTGPVSRMWETTSNANEMILSDKWSSFCISWEQTQFI